MAHALSATAPTPPSAPTIKLTTTAVEHYAQARPVLDEPQARAELTALLSHGVVQADPPSWVRASQERPYFLVIGEVYVLPLAARSGGRWWVATACLVRGSLRQSERARRRARSHARKARSRAARRARFAR